MKETGHLGRPALARNQSVVLFETKRATPPHLESVARAGLLDPTLGVRFSTLPKPSPWNAALEAAIKLPVAGERAYLSDGRAEFGLQATLQRISGHHGAYVASSAAHTRGDFFTSSRTGRIIPTAIAGYEYAWNERTSSCRGTHAAVPSIAPTPILALC